MAEKQRHLLGRVFEEEALALLFFVGLMWLVEIVNVAIFRGGLCNFGVRPRSLGGLAGIAFAPFLHGGFAHLSANTMPFLILGWLTMVRRIGDFFLVFFWAALGSGLGAWLFGAANSVHIGASGVIFGFLGFLLLRGWFERRLLSLLFSLAIGVLYGGMIWQVLPSQPGISWQSHLFGFLGGVFAARRAGQARRAGASSAQ